MDTVRFDKLLFSQAKIIKLIASQANLFSCLEVICLEIEKRLDDRGAKSSILLLKGRHLHHGAAPRLPLPYCEAIDGVEIGNNVGSCGTAAFYGKQIIVSDIENDIRWKDYAPLALSFDLRACWSTPIIASTGKILGTFAIYYDRALDPTAQHLDLINFFTVLASLAIEKSYAIERENILNKQLTQTIEKIQAFSKVMPDVGLILDSSGLFVDVYGNSEEVLNLNRKSLIGKFVTEILPKANAKEIIKVIRKTLSSNSLQVYEYDVAINGKWQTFEGRVAPIKNYLIEDRDKQHVVWMARDITDRKQAQIEIEKLAFYDPLTKLPNRRLLLERLNDVIKYTKRNKKVAGLIFIDLDNFKTINDEFGHSYGDQLLCDLASRLSVTLRETDMLARIGGDEFVVVLEGYQVNARTMRVEANIVCERILNAFKTPFDLKDKQIMSGASLGVSLIEGKATTADEVLGHADIAMYQAKKEGKGKAVFYDTPIK